MQKTENFGHQKPAPQYRTNNRGETWAVQTQFKNQNIERKIATGIEQKINSYEKV